MDSHIIYIPDESAARLVDVLSPAALSVQIDANLTIGIGGASSVSAELTISDGRTISDDLRPFIQAESSDEAIASAVVLDEAIYIQGVATGQTSVIIKQVSASFDFLDDFTQVFPLRGDNPKTLATVQITIQ